MVRFLTTVWRCQHLEKETNTIPPRARDAGRSILFVVFLSAMVCPSPAQSQYVSSYRPNHSSVRATVVRNRDLASRPVIAPEENSATFPKRTVLGALIGAAVGVGYLALHAEGRDLLPTSKERAVLAVSISVGALFGYLAERRPSAAMLSHHRPDYMMFAPYRSDSSP